MDRCTCHSDITENGVKHHTNKVLLKYVVDFEMKLATHEHKSAYVTSLGKQTQCQAYVVLMGLIQEDNGHIVSKYKLLVRKYQFNCKKITMNILTVITTVKKLP